MTSQSDKEQEFERELRRVYAEIDKFSNLYWSTRDEFELVRTQVGQKRTRSKVTEQDLRASAEWQKNTDAQFGYGEITKVSVPF